MALLDIFKKKKKKKAEKPEGERIQAKKKPDKEKIEKPKPKTEAVKGLKEPPFVKDSVSVPQALANKSEGRRKVPAELIQKGKEKKAGEFWQVLRAPHITEKAAESAEKNKYIFKIFPDVNKTQVKKAVESIYGVEVISVNTIKAPAKRRRLGRFQGWKAGYKKAVVKIKEGQKIEVLPR